MSTAIACIALSAQYGYAPALSEVNLELERGAGLGLLGRNGAGKSTLLRCIAGLHRPSAGSIHIYGRETQREPAFATARGGVSLVREGAPVFSQMTVLDNIKLGMALAIMRDKAPMDLDEVLGVFPAISSFVTRKAGLLSGGQRQMLALACALASRPDVILLDEPSAGLAPEAKRSVKSAVQQLIDGGMSVLVAEQDRTWLRDVVDEAILLDRGRVVDRVAP
jgi:branched-chain amino acid transport system ATP-binding protein